MSFAEHQLTRSSLPPFQVGVNSSLYRRATEFQRAQEVSTRAGKSETEATFGASGTPAASAPGKTTPLHSSIHIPSPPRARKAIARVLFSSCRSVSPVNTHWVACPARCAAQGRSLPLIVQGHSWGVQIGVLHGLHLWTPQEVVECVEGVWGPGDGLGRLAGLTRRAGARTQGVAALHVVHGAGNQVTWRRGKERKKGKESLSSRPTFLQADL